jgi:ribonuclease HII
MSYILGIDESGTGAWAGPFVVAGVLVPDEHPELLALLKEKRLRDSKKMTDLQRRAVLAELIAHVTVGKCAVVSVERLSEALRSGGNQRTAWRWAVGEVISQIEEFLGHRDVSIIVDGSIDKGLISDYPMVKFYTKADEKIAAVAAASVYAKTVRNDLLIGLSKTFPEYGFHRNYGYGTQEHRAALKKFGKTAQHRPIKPLSSMRHRA